MRIMISDRRFLLKRSVIAVLARERIVSMRKRWLYRVAARKIKGRWGINW
jgi:hypothetical protein